MGIRRLARQRAIQILYAMDCNSQPIEQAENALRMSGAKGGKSWATFARELAEAAFTNRKELDRTIAKALQHWRIERLSRMDRLCLRLALAELTYFSDIPLRVTINEYIEIARLFGTDDSPKFVNGVLDRLAEAFRHKDKKGGDPGDRDLDAEEAAAEAAIAEAIKEEEDEG